jgi:hypothetical protein
LLILRGEEQVIGDLGRLYVHSFYYPLRKPLRFYAKR